MGKKTYKNRLLDARKDRLDLRDRVYRPVLKSLPPSYPNVTHMDEVIKCYRDDDMILDQGESGACTGYALASVINYLLWERAIKKNYLDFIDYPLEVKSKKVSSKMLFNLARIYDEWDGEDYEGSSCRGAMKGWHKHGVCPEEYWIFENDEPKNNWELESVEHPLGAYYRVEKESIADIQSALCEVGALYASATVHDGWWEVSCNQEGDILDVERDLPKIIHEVFPRGNHAFVIVGYTRYGFIIQNSWGKTWGNCGFALLSYHDWLANGLDVWVSVMGVPVEVNRTPQTISSTALSKVSAQRKKSLRSEEEAYSHTLVLNANGRAKHTMINTFELERSVEIITYEKIKNWLEKSKKNRKIMIYALGGLENEKESIAKIQKLLPYFLENGIYPLFLTWQKSYLEAIEKSIEGLCEEDQSISQEGIDPEALNRAIESYGREIATRGIWAEIKEKSLNANRKKIKGFDDKKSGALYSLTMALKGLNDEYNGTLELHAMAHSAGSQLLATSWLTQLGKHKMRLHSFHLLAPTLSVQDANSFMTKAHKKKVFEKSDVYLYLLDQEMEALDSVGRYSHSLLCLISRSLEKLHKTPLLGLKDSWVRKNAFAKDAIFNTQQLEKLKAWYKFAYKDKNDRYEIYSLNKRRIKLSCSENHDFVALSHKNLDRSVFILDRIIKIVSTGSKDGSLSRQVDHLC